MTPWTLLFDRFGLTVYSSDTGTGFTVGFEIGRFHIGFGWRDKE